MNRYFEQLYPVLIKFQRDRYKKLLETDKGKKIDLNPGDSVLFYKPKIIGQKFFSAFAGPVKVFKKISYNTYLLKDSNSGKIFTRNIRNLRLLKQNDSNLTGEPDQSEIPENTGNFPNEVEIDPDLNLNLLFEE